jgi:hypothetical protein
VFLQIKIEFKAAVCGAAISDWVHMPEIDNQKYYGTSLKIDNHDKIVLLETTDR